MKVLVLIFYGAFCFCRFNVVESAGNWNYSAQDAWKYVPGWHCDGIRQSPVDFNLTGLVPNKELIDLVLWNFDQSYEGTLTNNGHSIEFEPVAGSPQALMQNHLGTYQLKQFHFHWGSYNGQGSEHSVMGGTISGELHFVTQKTTGVSTTGDALAVLGVFLVGHTIIDATNSLRALYDNVPIENDQTNRVSGVLLDELLPPDFTFGDYYHYEGSLTTPPCTEIVNWFVLREPLYVPEFVLERFRTVKGEDGQPLTKNFRYTQPLNGRNVMKIPEYIPHFH